MAAATSPLAELPDVALLDLGTLQKSPADIGKWNHANVMSALRLVVRVIQMRPWRFTLAHVPLAQNTPGVVRDLTLVLVLIISRTPYVLHLHGGHFDRYFGSAPGLVRGALQIAGRHASAGVVLTQSLRRCLQPIVPPERIVVIGNGSAAMGKATDYSGGVFKLLQLGTLSEAKGTLDLIEAVRPLQGTVELMLVGPAQPEVADLEMPDNVSIFPPVAGQQKADVFAQADGFALPSKFAYEGQPIALLEAMSAGLPIICTRRAGIPDSVAGGLFVEEGDVEELRSAILQLRNSPSMCARLGSENAERWQTEHTAERYVARVLSLWEMVGASQTSSVDFG